MNTTRIYELRDSVIEVAPEQDVKEVNRRIEDLERSIQEAMDLREQDETKARERLVDVLQRSQRLIVFMTEIEVTETVDIETLVPVVLTEPEKAAVRESLTTELATKQQTLSGLYDEVEDESLLEKATSTLNRIDEIEVDLASSTDFATFQTIAKEGLALVDDMIITLEESLTPKTDSSDTEPEAPESATSSAATTTPEATPDQATSTAEAADPEAPATPPAATGTPATSTPNAGEAVPESTPSVDTTP
jgi:hypothetical protein